jgi:hypothetical protein
MFEFSIFSVYTEREYVSVSRFPTLRHSDEWFWTLLFFNAGMVSISLAGISRQGTLSLNSQPRIRQEPANEYEASVMRMKMKYEL